MNEFLTKLSKSIICIENKETDELISGTFEVMYYIDKYSSIKIPSLRIFLNGEPVKTSKFLVHYKCECCNKEKTILIKKFLTKSNLVCSSCKELNIEKRKKQSEYITESFKFNGKVISKNIKISTSKNTMDYIHESESSFNGENDEFKFRFYNRHLNMKEYNAIRKNLYSVDNVVLTSNHKFVEFFKSFNQLKYTQKIYNEVEDSIISFKSVKMICDKCGALFNVSRLLKEKTVFNKIMCKDCSFCNKTFKIRMIKNIKNKNIRYQSGIELDFITFCNNKKICVENGFSISYYFNNKERKYNVDFLLPDYKLLIELKDNHIWHKKEVDNGNWKAKEECAIRFCENNGFQYKLIYSDNLVEFMNTFKI